MRFKLKSDGKTYETQPARLYEGEPICIAADGCLQHCSFISQRCFRLGLYPYCTEHGVVFMEVKDVLSDRT